MRLLLRNSQSGAFSVNAFVQHRGAGAVFRTIPSKVLTLEDLNAPKIFATSPNIPAALFWSPTHGLRQVHDAGRDGQSHQRKRLQPHPYGRGTLSNSSMRPKKCLINQREVGPHTLSFNNAPEIRPARRPGRHPGGRNARSGNDPLCADRRRNRPPGLRHPAHPSAAKTWTGSSTSRRQKRKWSAPCCPNPYGRSSPRPS